MYHNYCLGALAIAAIMLISCNKEIVPVSQDVNGATPVVTKAYGDKTPKIVVYVETNDVNPLNAGDYYLADGSQFVDVVELFAANIHMDDNGAPCLYFNDKLAPVLSEQGLSTYVRPLQEKGIKVVLTTLGDWQNIGVANMTDSQAQKFAEILDFVLREYDLDGIGFDDEYSGTSATVSGSWGNVISRLHNLIPSDKLITAFSYNHTSQISSTQGEMLDYAYTNFTYWNGTSGISGVTNDKWAPSSYNFSNSYNTSLVQYYAQKAKNDGYGAIMFFNLRQSSDVNPLTMFNAVAAGAFNSSVTVNGGDRNRTAGSITGGYTITYEDI